ncbi:aminotransferase class III-fold pyridoxal phosphate-dependent enzyme [bacterium BFN5]|nr:aminotransferase class III-fold pyridoxal phosphate-dependent enzyme [bacterium BFN5]
MLPGRFQPSPGAQAQEGAIQLARKSGKTISADKYEIITPSEGFHGRTLLPLTATAQPKYQKGYEPLSGGFHSVPYNDLAALTALVSEKTSCGMILKEFFRQRRK